MAALQGSFTVSGLSVTGGTTVTAIQIVAPTNQRLKLLRTVVSFDGTNSANTPATIQWVRQTGGTFTNTAVAPKKTNDPTGSLETLQASAKTGMTVAPTDTDLLDNFTEPVFGGLAIIPETPGQEVLIPGGTILGLKITAAQTVNCNISIRYEE